METLCFILTFVSFETQSGSRFRKTTRCQHIPRSCRSIKARYPQALSGVYTIRISTGTLQVYCEMSINGGAYTFLSIEGVAQLRRNDLRHLVRDKKTVLLRISNPDGTQPYTVIQPLKNDGVLSVQLSQHVNYNAPVNRHLGPYLYLGTLPKSEANKKTKQGFRSNRKEVSFINCDGNPNSHFAFIPNTQEKTPSRYHINNPIYEKRGVAVDFRASAKRPPSARRMPLDFFHLTEMTFGGCGCYTSSDRWLNPGTVHPALGTAIGLR